MRPSHRSRAPRYDFAAGCAALRSADQRLGQLMDRAGPFTLRLPCAQSPFEALLESIVFQQLHGRAAGAIHARLLDSFSPLCGVGVHPQPAQILACPDAQLRTAGLSANKASAIRDLAVKTLDGTVPSLARIRRMDDAAIIEQLTTVRGIGRWTVEMLLLFRLGRPDVLPTSDYAIRKGFALTFRGLDRRKKVTPLDLTAPREIEEHAQRWKPWRSIASWYLWRACDSAGPVAR